MGAPLGYSKDCAPRALAAVLDITFDDAARLLWPHRQLWEDPSRSKPGGSAYGTSERAIEDVLLRCGCLVDHFDGHGRLIADTTVLGRALRIKAHEMTASIRQAPRAAPPEENGGGAPPVSDPTPDSKPSWLDGLDTLSTWLSRHRVGHWLYCLTDGDGAHVVAAFGPNVLVGDLEGVHRNWLVYDAYRVHPPTDLNLEGIES